MQSLSAPKRSVAKADPAPSRWAYRLQRLWLTPVFRKLLRVGVPFTVSLAAGMVYFADEGRRDGVVLAIADMRAEIYSRPEFMVQLMAVDGASEGTNEDIREIVPVDFPISSFDLDLERIRQDIAGLAPVKDVNVRIRNGGVLQIDVSERVPVALWRHHEGLELIDSEGVRLGPVAGGRGEHGDLPLVAGKGAEQAIDEARRLYAAARPLNERMRGLVRMGERRWDVVLDRGQRIMLPESDPVQALERVIVLSGAQDMLARDLVAVDMRLAQRPTIRMNKGAVENWWKIREIAVATE
ncbi:cell division protein FtsQ/DivIB [Alisedimentitalea sp. MJ-SS2]|uniref:cell division protein FtsQ/DivIB n=1 Tax=Aliisedimentitalea sp. MJ-SS2 TaxID=3049795 RepID=UPI002909108A|nr:cell division protein FtsQ/DivIB [Alisedimentitalea sp. MJ-SS2]MDU8928893.1 cell division protein FtsQ/DivIB [Alisedimentitalea sp. MJ-SS2]